MKISLKPNIVKLAFRILRRNYGCPGLDGISLKEVKESYDFHQEVIVRRFEEEDINSQPIKKVEIIDYGGEERSIFVYCEGNALSPMLSNFYLSDFDKLYEECYARFSDDLFFAIDSKEDKEIITQEVVSRLQDLRLEINAKKTKIYERQSF